MGGFGGGERKHQTHRSCRHRVFFSSPNLDVPVEFKSLDFDLRV